MKYRGIKKAVGKMQHGHDVCCYRVYTDMSTGEVWADEYAAASSYSRYENKDIREVMAVTPRDPRPTMETVRRMLAITEESAYHLAVKAMAYAFEVETAANVYDYAAAAASKYNKAVTEVLHDIKQVRAVRA